MSLVVFSAVIVWVLILVTYIAFRRARQHGSSFRMPGGVVSAGVGLVGLGAVMATVFVRDSMTEAALIGVPAVLLAALLYALVVRRRIDRAAIARAIEEAEPAEAQ